MTLWWIFTGGFATIGIMGLVALACGVPHTEKWWTAVIVAFAITATSVVGYMVLNKADGGGLPGVTAPGAATVLSPGDIQRLAALEQRQGETILTLDSMRSAFEHIARTETTLAPRLQAIEEALDRLKAMGP